MLHIFPIEDFFSYFPQFQTEKYQETYVQSCGRRATMHITPSIEKMPLTGSYRVYALCLMCAHLITLDDMAKDENGDLNGTQIAGTPFKATVGSVSIENTKPNSFQSDDWNYWLNMTAYGRELLALLEAHAAGGIYISRDSARDLL